jgi:hypothetical protein
LTVSAVLYLAVVFTLARATVDTRTLVVEYCTGLALLMDARHANGAAKAAGASSTAITELRPRLSTVTKATRKPHLDRLGVGQDCGSMTTDSSYILGRAKDHSDERPY